MPTIPPQVTPYYGGGQVVNPANVLQATAAPTTAFTEDRLGTLWVDYTNGNIYALVQKASSVDTWVLLGGSSGAVSAVNGTANQITANTVGNVVTLSIPSTFIAPGSIASTTTITAGTGLTVTTGNAVVSAGNITATLGNIAATAGSVSAGTTVTAGTGITSTTGNIVATAGQVNAGTSMTAGTSITATLGAITATNGNVVLGTAGNGLSVKSGSNARIGVGAVLSGGTLDIANTSVTANTVVLVSVTTLGTVTAAQAMHVTKDPGVKFTVTSADATDTSTFDWYLVEST